MKPKLLDILRLLAFPLVPIYMAVVKLRNFLFNIHVLSATKVGAVVFSVGNFTVGGSGKTPFVIYLTNLLTQKGRKPGVLSRGYGRTSSGYVLVSDGLEIKTDVMTAGDEMYYTAHDCMVPAAVCEDRVNGARQLINDCGTDTLVLDDAFQHRWIERDGNIVIIDQRFINHARRLRRFMLPTGNFREPLSSLKRADCVIINRKFSALEKIAPSILANLSPGAGIFTAGYKAVGFIDVRHNKFYEPEEFRGQKSLLICGVANPHSFKEALASIGLTVDDKIIFTDHKNYSLDDVQLIRKEFYNKNSNSVITTQKDAVKLMRFKKELDDIDIYYLKIAVVMDDQESFDAYIDSKFETVTKN